MSSLLQPNWKEWSTDAVDLSSSPNLASYPGCSLKKKMAWQLTRVHTVDFHCCWQYQSDIRILHVTFVEFQYYCIINLSQHIQLALGMTVLFECLLLLCATTTVQYLQTKWFKTKNLFESRVAVYWKLAKLTSVSENESIASGASRVR